MQRKAFRIEAMLAPRRPLAGGHAMRDTAAPRADSAELQSLKAELAFIHDLIARNKRELSALIGDDKERRFARAGDELNAAVSAMRGATDKILSHAEAADDNARTLAASLSDDFKRGLAQDMQEQIVNIYEACNFQDIAGQHISKVTEMLGAVEQQLGSILARSNGMHAAAQARMSAPQDALLNGPKLAGDSGHATQHDIDQMFAHG